MKSHCISKIYLQSCTLALHSKEVFFNLQTVFFKKRKTSLYVQLLNNGHFICVIKTKTKFEKETRHRFYVFMKKKKDNSAKCATTGTAHSVHLHRHDVLNVLLTVLLHCPITSTDAYTVLLVLKPGWW